MFNLYQPNTFGNTVNASYVQTLFITVDVLFGEPMQKMMCRRLSQTHDV